jgi:hypothetical protein
VSYVCYEVSLYCHIFWVSMTNNNGFWIWWLDLLALLLQLKSIITAHNEWLSTTHAIPYWTTSVSSSTAMNDKWRITAHTLNSFWILLRMNHDSFITSKLHEYRSPPRTVSCHSPLPRECVFWSVVSTVAETRASEPLPSKCTSTSVHCYSGF